MVVREVNLHVHQAKVKLNSWIILPPFVALVAAAVYLRLRWESLPQRFPVHWGIDAQPNGWANRSWLGVYGPLLFGGTLDAFLLALAWIISRLKRETMMRYVTVRCLEFLVYPVTLSFILLSLQPLVSTQVWAVPILILISIAGLICWSYIKIRSSCESDQIPAFNSDIYWRGGIIYWNPHDPAILVPKRVGIGYTFNFANKWSWIAVIAIVGVVLIPYFLHHR
jgi:uncharacterized membrane protein